MKKDVYFIINLTSEEMMVHSFVESV